MITYRGWDIPDSHYNIGCEIAFLRKPGRGHGYGQELVSRKKFKPNGTGGENTHWLIRSILQKLPSDKFQVDGSNPHDLMYAIGGTEKDRRFADKKMYLFAKESVKQSLSWYNPLRHFFIARMRMNLFGVRYFGRSSFNYNTHEFAVYPDLDLEDLYRYKKSG